MENNKIVNSDLKVGDIVKVVDSGHQFTCYEDFYNQAQVAGCKRFKKGKSNINGEHGKIINYKYDKYNEENLYLVNMQDENCAVFSKEGIARVNKFRQGDEVIRVNTPSLLCELGKIAIVSENVMGVDDKCMIKLANKIGTFKENTFKLLSESRRFKAGDIVKRIDGSYHGMNIGDTSKIVAIEEGLGNLILEDYTGKHADYNFIKIESYEPIEEIDFDDKEELIEIWEDKEIEDNDKEYIEKLENNENKLKNEIKHLKLENKKLKAENRVVKSEVKRYKPKEVVIDKCESISAIERMNCPIDFEVVRFGDEITVTIYNAELTKKLAIGKSKRNPKDDFNLETGIKIAACRALIKLFETREKSLMDDLEMKHYLKNINI